MLPVNFESQPLNVELKGLFVIKDPKDGNHARGHVIKSL